MIREEYESFEQRIYQKLCYDNGTLRNKENIQDKNELASFEDKLVSLKMPSRPILNTFSLKEIQKIHFFLFGELYEWAGNLRFFSTAREAVPFCSPEYISPWYEKQIFKPLQQDFSFHSMSETEFITKSAYFINEFNAIHPFVDGNGRLTRILLQDLALKNHIPLTLQFIEKEKWYHAMKIGFDTGNTFLIEQEIKKMIEHKKYLNKQEKEC